MAPPIPQGWFQKLQTTGLQVGEHLSFRRSEGSLTATLQVT